MAVLLAQVIGIVESMPADRRPGWWRTVWAPARSGDDIRHRLALEGWSDAVEWREFATLLEEAADQLGGRGPVTADEAAAWIILDDQPVIFRGDQPMDTKPVAELGRAVAALGAFLSE